MKRTLVLVFAVVLVAIVAGCGGGGGGGGGPTTTPTPTPKYGALSHAVGSDCAFLVGAISIGSASQSSVSSAARSACQTSANQRAQAAGTSSPSCAQPRTFRDCAAFAAGEDTAGRCYIAFAAGSSRSAVRQTARNTCESRLGSGANCEDLNSACTSDTSSPPVGVWTPTPTAPPPGGVGSTQVGNEFGRTSTSGRTNLNLTCTDDVVFSNSGNVVLPSVDVVALPSASGTVTLEYDAYNIPDRFVVEVGGRVMIDTQYVGTSNSVAEVNAILNRYGFTPTSQASIISPGGGSRSFPKAAGVTSAVVRVYAPLEGTAWEVTLKFAGSSCQSTGPGPNTPVEDVNVTIPASCARQVQVCVRDHECEDGDQVRVSLNGSVIFSGELFNAWDCQNVPVRQGANRFELFAINGTGFKGNCSHRDVNTGEIVITGGNTRGNQSWRHSGGTGSHANLNVTIGPSGGTCTPTGSEPGSNTGPGTGPGTGTRLYGAVATAFHSQCQGRAVGMSSGHSDEASAISKALQECRARRSSSLPGCEVLDRFGSAYTGYNECAAVAYGEQRISGNLTECRLLVGIGSTESAAQSDALSECRSGGFSCSLEPSDRGGLLSACAQ